MEQRSFIIKLIIGSILIGIAVAANYCQLCRNHVACRPKRGFGRACGNRRVVVSLREGEQKLILQIHNGLRSVVASGLLRGFQPASRMGHIQWHDELAKLALINARQCFVHYDRCRKTEEFPWSGQNVGMDQAIKQYRPTNQSIYRITLQWFRQQELANAQSMNLFHVPKNKRKRFTNFATIVHDRQTHVGCAAVRFRKGKYFNFNLVCNYAMRVLENRKVYEVGIPYSGCTSGRSTDYPSLCSITEPIKAIAHPKIADNTISAAFSTDYLQQPPHIQQINAFPQQSISYPQNAYTNSNQQSIPYPQQSIPYQQNAYTNSNQQPIAQQTNNLIKKQTKKKQTPKRKQVKKRIPNRTQTQTRTQYQRQSNPVFNPFGFFFG